MKTPGFPLLIAILAGLSLTASAAVTFTVTPVAVSNTYDGVITLAINGLTNGETVLVQKYLSADRAATVNTNAVLWQQFNLSDGGNSVIGGVTNLNVPGDVDGLMNGQITTKLSQPVDFSQNLVGNYFFVLSSPQGHFLAITNSFTVTNFPYTQQFTGLVVNNGTAVPYAKIILFPGTGSSGGGPGNPVGGTVANSAGEYVLSAPVGNYSLMPFQAGYVANLNGAASLVLSNGANFHTNLNLTAATQIIAGKFVDANDATTGLPGLLLSAQSKSGWFGIGGTDARGNFSIGVTSNQWRISNPSAGTTLHGYLQLQNKTVVDTSTGSVSGVTIALPKATALFYGTVTDNQGNPLPGEVQLYANDNYNNLFEATGYADTQGHYAAGILGGLANDAWNVSIDNNSSIPNNIFSQPAFNQNGGTNLAAGQAVLVNFTAIPATNVISGKVQYNGAALTGVGVGASATIGGRNYNLNNVDTDANGNYSLTVAAGVWNVYVSQCCNNDSLDNLLGIGNFLNPNNVTVYIVGNNGTANFTVTACTGVHIITAGLPAGTLDNYYDFYLQASSCNDSFTWFQISGALPPGLNFSSGGEIFGTAVATGTYTFTVGAQDGSGFSTNQTFSLRINPPAAQLQVTTTFLPAGTNGTGYGQTLQATGGQPPYVWSLAPGSAALPAGLGLGTNGVISGRPAATGTNLSFIVQLTDAAATSVQQLLSLTITASASPMGVTLTAPGLVTAGRFEFSFYATAGVNYAIQYSTTLGNWTDLVTLAGTGGNLTIIAPTLAGNGQRFYRVKTGL